MDKLQSNRDQLEMLAKNESQNTVVMLNLLTFKKDGGRVAYLNYMKAVDQIMKGVGARLLFMGKASELLYGTERWDAVMLVQYPSREAFLRMVNNPDYLKIHEYREQALERTVLYAIDPIEVADILD